MIMIQDPEKTQEFFVICMMVVQEKNQDTIGIQEELLTKHQKNSKNLDLLIPIGDQK